MSDRHQKKRLNIALVTALDPFDRRSWSGTYYFIAQALQKHCGDVTCIGPMDASQAMWGGMLLHGAAKLLCNKVFAYRYSPAVSKKYAQIAAEKLASRSFDVVMAVTGATELAFLRTSLPKVLIEDANFALLQNYHFRFFSLLKISARQLDELQARGLANADLVLYSSMWAAQGAIDYYATSGQKIRVIPFGANLENVPARDLVLARRKHDRCRLLFVGVDWESKGGAIAFETLIALEDLEIPAELIICGCVPPKKINHPRMKVIPFLNKNDSQQRQQLHELYLQSDFFVLPTRCECFGITFCEASAFGLPILATRTGGVPEVVREGVNGFTLPPDARGDAYAQVIARLYQDSSLYQQYVQMGRDRFETHLNWDAWGLETQKALMEIVPQKRIFSVSPPFERSQECQDAESKPMCAK
jgi:glycosyltransferase involved in cell wall biosynthesis